MTDITPDAQPAGQPVPQPVYVMAPVAPPVAVKAGNTEAILAFIFGLISLFGVGSIIAIVLGSISRSKSREAKQQPLGLATAGLVLGWIGVIAVAIFIIAVATKGPDQTCYDYFGAPTAC